MTDTTGALFDLADVPVAPKRGKVLTIPLSVVGTGPPEPWTAGIETAKIVKLFLDSGITGTPGNWVGRSQVSMVDLAGFDQHAAILALVQIPGVDWTFCPTCGRGRCAATDIKTCTLTPGCGGATIKVTKGKPLQVDWPGSGRSNEPVPYPSA